MRNLVRSLLCIALVPLPMFLKRFLMRLLFGYELHPSAKIGWSFVAARRLVMAKNASIGSFTVIKKIDVLMGESSSIGRGNWITGFPQSDNSMFPMPREAQLEMGEQSAITHRHLLDCTAKITVGKFATIAGWMSQIMTHSIDLSSSRQACRPISIGAYCFVGTRVVILGGSTLPDYSVLGAASLLNKEFTEQFCLWGGVPAKKIKELPREMAYFTRAQGAVS